MWADAVDPPFSKQFCPAISAQTRINAQTTIKIIGGFHRFGFRVMRPPFALLNPAFQHIMFAHDTNQYTKVITELRKALKQKGSSEKAEHSKRFFKTAPGQYGHGDTFFGITVPEQRKIATQFWKEASFANIEKLMKDPVHEVRLTALFILRKKYAKDPEQAYTTFLNCIPGINNWDLVDSSAPYIVGEHLMTRERDILYTYAKSADLWKKRIAIIATYTFIKHKDFKDALAISEILINDSHDLIHKAVGWMLREIGKKDQAIEKAFLQKHYKTMPRTMLRYAIEQFDEPLRKKYLKGEI